MLPSTIDLLDLIRRPEGKTLEFKRDLSSPAGALRTIVAFANTAGGILLIGVEDRTRHVRGVADARKRLLRELARYLACAASEGEDFNAAFHRSMERGGQVGALLLRAHGLIGYPEWPASLVRTAIEAAERLGANQRTNLLLGTPLEASVRDPRWEAGTTLAHELRPLEHAAPGV